MASARNEEEPSPESSLEMNIFDCSICLQIFTRPKVLPCGHTFCKKCLVTYVKGGRFFKCPTCNRSVSLKKEGSAGVDCLTDNISLGNLREDFSSLKVQRQGRAPQGAEGNSSLAEYVCEKHPGEALKFYCPVCEDAICEECMLSDHNTHGVMRLSKALEEQAGRARQAIEEGNGLVANVRGKIAALQGEGEKLVEEQNAQLRAIDEVVPKLKRATREAIEQRASEMKEEVKNMVLAEAAGLANQTEELETLLAKFLNGVDEVERCINTGATIPLIRGRKVLNEIIQSLLGGSSSALAPCGTVVFTPADAGTTPIPFGTVERVARVGNSSSATLFSSPPPSNPNGDHLSDGMDGLWVNDRDSDTEEDIDVVANILGTPQSIPGTALLVYDAAGGGLSSHGSRGLGLNSPLTVNQQATSSTPRIQSPLQYGLPQYRGPNATWSSGVPYPSPLQGYSTAVMTTSASQTNQATTSPAQYPYPPYPAPGGRGQSPLRPTHGVLYPGSPGLQGYSTATSASQTNHATTSPAQHPYPYDPPLGGFMYTQRLPLSSPFFSPLPQPMRIPTKMPGGRLAVNQRGVWTENDVIFPPSENGIPPSVSAQKREKKLIKIVDNTGRDVTEEILRGESGTSSPTLPKSTNN